jgi:hypothetical protein
MLLWGESLPFNEGTNTGNKVFRVFAAHEQGFCIPPTIQPLHVLAFEAALLAGNKIDEDSDDYTLAKQNLRVIPWNAQGKARSKAEKKKKRAIERDLLKSLEVSRYGASSRQEHFMQELLGTKLAAHAKIRFGFDHNAKEDECEDPLPLFMYFAARGKVETLSCSSYQRNDMHKMEWDDTVPDAVDRWAFLKATKLLGLDVSEKPSLILTMFVPPAKAAYGGEVYDY